MSEILTEYSKSSTEFVSKFKNLKNIEIEYDLNKNKNPFYIDFNVYSKILKFFNIKSKMEKLDIKIQNILDIGYNIEINNKNYNYRLSLISNNNEPIPFISRFKNSKNIIVFKILTDKYLKNKPDNIEYIIKERTDKNNILDIEDFNIRLRVKEEKPVNQNIEITQNNNFTIRYKKRVSLILNKNVKIDLTDVKYLETIADLSKENFTKQTYELEIEYFESSFNEKNFKDSQKLIFEFIDKLLKLINNTQLLLTQTEKNKVIEDFSRLFNNPIDYVNFKLPYVQVQTMERQHLYDVPNKYIVSDKIDGERGLLFTTNGKAYLLLMDHKIIDTGYKVDKIFNNSVLDGEYVFNAKYKKFIFIVFDCLFVGGKDTRWDKSLISRVLKGNDLINKCFVDKGSHFKSYDYNLKSRNQKELYDFYKSYILEYQKMLNDDLKILENNKILIRHGLFLDIKGFSANEIFKYADLLWSVYNNNANDYVFKSDGIIFHPKNANYNNIDNREQRVLLLKWKPINRNTIDFYIEFERNPLTGKIEEVYDNSSKKKEKKTEKDDKTAAIDNDETETGISGKYKICKLYVSKQFGQIHKPVLFNPKINNNGDIHIVYLPIVNNTVKDLSGNILTDKTVVEFYYNIDGNNENYHFNWVPVKTRYDKTLIMRLNKIKYGNSDVVAYNNWNSINYPVRDTDLKKLADDKLYNNEIDTLVKSVLNVEIKDISEKQINDLKNQRIFNDLNFNKHNFYNMIKTIICNTYLSDKFDNIKKSVLDIGIGYGFDIFKYYDAEVNDMVCIDSDYLKLSHPTLGAFQRLAKAKRDYPAFPQCDFINADISKPFNVEVQESVIQNISKENKELIDKYLNKKKYDCILMFDVLQYFLKDAETLNILCDNINKTLKDNGILIFTLLDKKLIDSKIKDTKYTETYFTNNQLLTIYEINKNKENGDFETIDILNPVENLNPMPHYLINQDLLIKTLEDKCKLNLIESDTFENIFNNMREYINICSKIDSEHKTRKFFNDKIIKFYEETEINKKNQNILFLNNYYIFSK